MNYLPLEAVWDTDVLLLGKLSNESLNLCIGDCFVDLEFELQHVEKAFVRILCHVDNFCQREGGGF